MSNPKEATKKTWTTPIIEDLNSKNNEGGKPYNDHEITTTAANAGPS